jgi:hypothetical protein
MYRTDASRRPNCSTVCSIMLGIVGWIEQNACTPPIAPGTRKRDEQLGMGKRGKPTLDVVMRRELHIEARLREPA